MGRAARASVAERSWPVLCEQLLDHYRTAMAGDVGDRRCTRQPCVSTGR